MIDKKQDNSQVFYNGRYVDRKTFRAFVYNEDSQQLAKSYEEYEKLIGSGLWFSDKEKAVAKKEVDAPKVRKPKDVANS